MGVKQPYQYDCEVARVRTVLCARKPDLRTALPVQSFPSHTKRCGSSGAAFIAGYQRSEKPGMMRRQIGNESAQASGRSNSDAKRRFQASEGWWRQACNPTPVLKAAQPRMAKMPQWQCAMAREVALIYS